MKKSFIAVVIIVIIAALIVFWRYSNITQSDTTTNQPKPADEIVTGDFPVFDDSTESITKDIDSIGVDELGADFGSMDADINSF
jgi:uncharacterized alpha/beta hydrolase family protein